MVVETEPSRFPEYQRLNVPLLPLLIMDDDTKAFLSYEMTVPGAPPC